MKKPIDWHESCLFNANVNLHKQLESVKRGREIVPFEKIKFSGPLPEPEGWDQ